jgi:tRNA modification GTPase
MEENIFALSTIIGRSGVAVIRASGPTVLDALRKLGVTDLLKPNQVRPVKIYSPSSPDNDIIDRCLILYFKAPNSFTGEDIIEFQTHGSIAVIEELLTELGKIKNFRLAEPGEFSKRAFLNNKLDLTQAEGLVDLIEAETSIQKKVALRQVGGQLRKLYDKWRSDIIFILAQLEAYIDFPEDDIPDSAIDTAKNKITSLVWEINKHLQDDRKGEILLRGIRVAIVGAPNVGKSTLINCLSKRDVAIVSDIAGTTRDVLEVKLNIEGHPFMIYDTAGIRDAENPIEQEGIKRAKMTLANADVCILMVDASDFSTFGLIGALDESYPETILLVNKIDLNDSFSHKCYKADAFAMIRETSLKKQTNVDILILDLLQLAKKKYSLNSDPLITKARYRNNLLHCLEYLNDFLKSNKSLELMVEDVRLSANSLGNITGKINMDEILDEIFSTFCIGK